MVNTPNLQLDLIPADRRVWADRMNSNLKLIDAAVGAYFTLQNLQGLWENSHAYTVDQTVVDPDTGTVWTCQVAHTSIGIPGTFADDRAANDTYWTVYSSPARARGAWTGPGTTYSVNDFVVSGSKYAVCIVAHTSGLSFDTDEIDGKWSVLVDLSAAGSQVLPVPGGAADANKFVVTTSTGLGYTISNADAVLLLLGTTTVGKALLQAADASAGRTAINAQVAGSYQSADASLTALSGASIGAFGLAWLGVATVAAARAAITPLTTNGDLWTRIAGADDRLAIGSTGQSLQVVSGLPAWGNGGLIGFQVFTSSGTYTPTSGMRTCLAIAVGSGGGGGGVGSSAASSLGAAGGGAGSTSYKRLTAADIGASKAVTIASGGAGGIGANDGAAGGDSSLDTLCIGKGGSGGAQASAFGYGTGGAGGVAGTGDLNVPGMPGFGGVGAIGASVATKGGAGGSSPYGAGGREVAQIASGAVTNGNNGTGNGSGGSGATNLAAGGATTANGGNGTAGIVIIFEYN